MIFRLALLLSAAIATPATAHQALPSPATTPPPPQGQPVPAVPASSVAGPIEHLKPGEFLWAPDIAPDGPVTIIVSLAAQRAYAYRNGVPIGVSTVSTGKKGHETPTGVFTILQKDVDHHSNTYDNAPMPFMQRLTWDGVALHGGKLPGYPASHGCVRLPLAFAKNLFAITRMGVTVVITDQATAPEVAPSPSPLASNDDGHVTEAAYRWHPDRAPTGPVSIVVSGRDRRMLVLRNGVEIGSAPIVLDAPVTATAAFTLARIDAAGPHWMRLPLPDGAAKTAQGTLAELTPAERASGHIPDGFRLALEQVLRPGATMLVTRDTLASSGTGTRLRVLDTR
ncbi:Lipoprotein-anchoring transpeptidase ErfK/SrfK [Sphingomonas gellani]|uniref:Lipoprotein-anchoring transpeptidase ErfK/SrfK n=1 Tax=Sphingomonas gellani TaxID=1166340 RepID=A0A1H7YW73_9SPHN|nr:L,D-transpeptidase [Sphingomonas gellani]SEM50390.1 Lipoprotein-anchoring transpeptidase ErfK/SrfK [Sphingomonas gellani]